jgi:hypothetical protein
MVELFHLEELGRKYQEGVELKDMESGIDKWIGERT